MAFSPAAWLSETGRTFFGNATAVRDFRSQIRGNRALGLLTVYLSVMLLIVSILYSANAETASVSMATAQRSLNQFYITVLMLLATAITAIMPALSAMAVIGERQRRSLDLVFSAPVTPYYFLVGKLISSFRWTAMLIALAFPFASVSIVMGGATWSDALGSFMVLLWAGLLFSAMGVLISSFAASPTAAIMQTYVLVGGYALVTGIVASASAVPRFLMGGSMEMPWWVALSPFSAGLIGSSATDLFGYAIPNWILVGVATLAAVRMLLLGAASSLSGFEARETRRLRVEGLVVMVFLGLLLAGLAAPNTVWAGGSSPFGAGWGATTALVAMPLLALIPNLSCWNVDADRKYRFDGFFDWRSVWRGTPSGSLPYLLLLWTGLFAGSAARGLFWQGGALDLEFLTRAVWTLAFLFFWWALGQFVSAWSKTLRGARVSAFAFLLILLVLPLPVLTIGSAAYAYGEDRYSQFNFHMAAPLYMRDDTTAIVHTVVLLAFGIGAVVFARSRVSELGYRHGNK